MQGSLGALYLILFEYCEPPHKRIGDNVETETHEMTEMEILITEFNMEEVLKISLGNWHLELIPKITA